MRPAQQRDALQEVSLGDAPESPGPSRFSPESALAALRPCRAHTGLQDEINLEPPHFKTAVDKVTGFGLDGEGFTLIFNDTRLTSADDGMVTEYYDRKTMEYSYQNTTGDLEITGPRTVTRATGKR